MSKTKTKLKKALMPWWLFVTLSISGHIVTPLVFGTLVYIHIWEHRNLSWELIAAVVVMTLPFLLPLLATYISSLKGVVKFNLPARPSATENVEFIRSLPKITVAVPVGPPAAAPAPAMQFNDFSIQAKKVIRTLWNFQDKTNLNQRWGFGIRPPAPDYTEFRIGATELLSLGHTVEDARGLVFLSDTGITLCQQGLDEGDMWKNFGSAE